LRGKAFNEDLVLKVFEARCKKSNVKQVNEYQIHCKKQKPRDADLNVDGKSTQSTMVQL
jgi:hypothetical protein